MRVTITTDDGEVLDTFHVSEPEGQMDIQAANNLRQHIELGWEVWGFDDDEDLQARVEQAERAAGRDRSP